MSQRVPRLVLSLYIADLDGWLAHDSLSTSVKHAFHPVYNRVPSSGQQNQWDNRTAGGSIFSRKFRKQTCTLGYDMTQLHCFVLVSGYVC